MMSSAQEILQTVFGYEQFRPGQAQVIQQVLNQQSTLAVMCDDELGGSFNDVEFMVVE